MRCHLEAGRCLGGACSAWSRGSRPSGPPGHSQAFALLPLVPSSPLQTALVGLSSPNPRHPGCRRAPPALGCAAERVAAGGGTSPRLFPAPGWGHGTATARVPRPELATLRPGPPLRPLRCFPGVKPGHSMGFPSCSSCGHVFAGGELRDGLSMPVTRQEMLGEPKKCWENLSFPGPVCSLSAPCREGRGPAGLPVWALVETRPDPQPARGVTAEFVQRRPGSLTCLNTSYCCWKSISFQANLYQHWENCCYRALESVPAACRRPAMPPTVTAGDPRERGFGLELAGRRDGWGVPAPSFCTR